MMGGRGAITFRNETRYIRQGFFFVVLYEPISRVGRADDTHIDQQFCPDRSGGERGGHGVARFGCVRTVDRLIITRRIVVVVSGQ